MTVFCICRIIITTQLNTRENLGALLCCSSQAQYSTDTLGMYDVWGLHSSPVFTCTYEPY